MMNEATRSKLTRAHQRLIESSKAYDAGCMAIKEILDSDKPDYKKPPTRAVVINEVMEEILSTNTFLPVDGFDTVIFVKDVIKILNKARNNG